MGPIPSLKQLSILAVLQGLLNSRAKQAYLRLTFPFWKHPGWSAWHDNSLILKGTLWPWHYKYLYVQYSLVPGPGTCTFWHSYLEWWHHSTSDSGTHTSFYFYISPASHSKDLSHYLLTSTLVLHLILYCLAVLAHIASAWQENSSPFKPCHMFKNLTSNQINWLSLYLFASDDPITCPCAQTPCQNPCHLRCPRCYTREHVIFHCALMAPYCLNNIYTLQTILQSEDHSTHLCEFLQLTNSSLLHPLHPLAPWLDPLWVNYHYIYITYPIYAVTRKGSHTLTYT